MRVLGVDPGYAITGYSVIEYSDNKINLLKAGAIETNKDEEFIDRLEKIDEKINCIINEFKPDVLSIEELFFNTNIKTGIKVAEARGIILLAAKKNNLEISEFTPIQVKLGVCGYGRAEKKQVQMMVKSILALPGIPKLDDITDSMAIAICYIHGYKQKNLFKKYGEKYV